MGRALPLIGIPVYKSESCAPPHIPLYALHRLYSECVAAARGAPLQIPHGVDKETLRAIFERIDGVLLAGGGDVDPACYGETPGALVYGVDRERDRMEMTLVRWAVAEDKPLLAICRGHQVMNVALGGSLYQDVLTEMAGAMRHAYFERLGFTRDHPAHKVELSPDGRLADMLGGDCFVVNSLHHQGIKALAPDLTPAGHAPDGLIEAVEVKGHGFALGVQWHPEALAPSDPVMGGLFEGLVEAARNGSERGR